MIGMVILPMIKVIVHGNYIDGQNKIATYLGDVELPKDTT
jgi:hypothetical protein